MKNGIQTFQMESTAAGKARGVQKTLSAEQVRSQQTDTEAGIDDDKVGSESSKPG